jgi:hypothetical protein
MVVGSPESERPIVEISLVQAGFYR